MFSPRKQRRYQQRTETGAQDNLVHSRRSSLPQIGDLDRLRVRERQLDVGIVQADVLMS